MSDTSKLSTCQIVCWGLAGSTGVLVIWSTAEAVGGLAALMLGIAFAVFSGLVLNRLVCTGYAPWDRGIEAEDVKARLREVTGITGYKAPDDEAAHAMASQPEMTVALTPEDRLVQRENDVAANPSEARPEGIDAPRGGRADDLKRIKGIGPKLESLCHQLGFYHFDQIAGWGPQEVAWVDENLTGFKGRVSRDNWVGQAKILVAGGEPESAGRASGADVT